MVFEYQICSRELLSLGPAVAWHGRTGEAGALRCTHARLSGGGARQWPGIELSLISLASLKYPYSNNQRTTTYKVVI